MTKTGKDLLAHVVTVKEGEYEGAGGYISKYVPKKKSETGEAYYEAWVTHEGKLAHIAMYPNEFEVRSSNPLPWVSR